MAMRRRAIVAVVSVVALGAGLAVSRTAAAVGQQLGIGQTGQNPGMQMPSQQSTHQPPSLDVPAPDERIEAGQRRARGVERQKRMVADSQRLTVLAAEVNAAVGDQAKGQISEDVVRKVAEIEKLAHGVRERMKGQ